MFCGCNVHPVISQLFGSYLHFTFICNNGSFIKICLVSVKDVLSQLYDILEICYVCMQNQKTDSNEDNFQIFTFYRSSGPGHDRLQ